MESRQLDLFSIENIESLRAVVKENLFSDHPESKTIKFGLFYPQIFFEEYAPVERKITITERNLIMQLYCLEENQLLNMIKSVNNEMITGFNQSDSSNQALLDLINIFNQLNSDCDGTPKSLLQTSKKILEQVLNKIEKQTNQSVKVKNLTLELKIYLLAFCLMLNTAARQKEVLNILTSDTSNKVPHPIKEKAESNMYVTQGEHTVLTMMTKIHNKESLSIIISILQSFKQRIKNEEDLKETKECIDFYLKHFDEEYLVTWMDRIKSNEHRGAKKQQLKQEFDNLKLNIQKIKFTEKTSNYFEELRLWLKALYLYPYSTWSFFEDGGLFAATGYNRNTFYKVYFDCSETLELKNSIYQMAQPIRVKEDDKKEVVPVKEQSRGRENFFQPLETKNPKVINVSYIEPGQRNNQVNEYQLWLIIDEAKNSNDDDRKLDAFERAFIAFQPSENQLNRINNLKNKVLSAAKFYPTNTYFKSIPVVGTVAAYLKPRDHVDIANEMIAKTEEITDSRMYVLYLFDKLYELYNRASEEFYDAIRKILIDAVNALHAYRPLEEGKLANTHRDKKEKKEKKVKVDKKEKKEKRSKHQPTLFAEKSDTSTPTAVKSPGLNHT